MNIIMGINHKPWLSPTIYNSLQSFVEFKVNFHHMYIKARKHPMKKWNELSYLTTDDVIFIVLESWPPKWHAPSNSAIEIDKFAAQWKKEEAKLWMAQLAEKRRKEAATIKPQEMGDAAQEIVEQQKIAIEQ